MTRNREKGENDLTRAAKREARRTGKSVAEILASMLAEARKLKDKALQARIIQAQKYMRSRNRRKRKGRK